MSAIPAESSEECNQQLRNQGRKKKQPKKDNLDRRDDGVIYPFDVWSYIGKFIAPEQVKKFSLICHASWQVTLTTQFWLCLYQKHVRNFDGLPLKLQPFNIDAGCGLLPRVVRALHYVYPPLATRKRELTSLLINRRCLAVWWEKDYSLKKHSFVWTYFLKFVEINGKKIHQDNLRTNPEERNLIVRAKCPNFVHLYQQSFTGMVITSFNACMSSDMRYHQLKMMFHVERRDIKYKREEGYLLVINPVIEYAVIPWWDPNYPYPVQ